MSSAAALHAVAAGPPGAPVVLLTHSLGASLSMWDAQATALSERFRVVRCDLRGHGRSPVLDGPYEIADLGGDLMALLDRLGVARAHVCGLSLGAMAAMWLAAHHPRRVGRLVLCCTSARLGPPEAWAARAATVRAQGMESIADGVVGRWFTPAFAAVHPDVVAAARAGLVATPVAGYAGCCGAIERMDLTAELGLIRAPALAVAGADDVATPPEHLARIAAGIPRCRLEVVPRAAHLANVEQPRVVTDLIAAHLGAEEDPT